MDELLIEDKKYISSKQAAKVTGYAKDYIGQLCREGRLPARLVGRNWYVLETAVRDHRFGEETPKQEPKRGKSHESRSFVSSAWESPRYGPAPLEELITADSNQRISADENNSAESAPLNMAETWKSWFEQVASIATTPITASNEIEKANFEPEERAERVEGPGEKSEESVDIPIRAIYRHPPKELLPDFPKEAEDKGDDQPKSRGKRMVSAIYLSGALVAVCTMALAILGTGYFDKYIESDKRASLMAGVVVYEIDR
ncbi:helix-turn-helix domain-containing protein [Candidatus Kaiserbacteria bacterium]|nr:helix-turn-helix domain-containing protein [Candidatus Kaiserbacteria bacterium]